MTDNLNGHHQNNSRGANGRRPYQRLIPIFLAGLNIPISDIEELDQIVRDSEFMLMENEISNDANCFDEF